jgi:meso-butanediol dehydrogenase / (S,S)-butanediol dehydrogenase / diacetyl reductase
MSETLRRSLSEQVVFVSGAASGIGKACAIAYASEGAHVVVADINYEAAQSVVEALDVPGLALECDVASEASVCQAIEKTIRTFSSLNAIHNNAGLSSPSKPLHETTVGEWNALFDVNLKSIYWTTRSGLEFLKRTRGTILNTASMVGMLGQPNHAAYVATKGALIALTKAMALDYAPFGIRVNAICPAGVRTELLSKWIEEQPDPASALRYLDEIHLMGPCPDPDVIADAAVFLLSRQARFITGCALPVSGGAELGYRR